MGYDKLSKVDLTPEESAKLQKIAQDEEALKHFLDAIVNNGRAKMAEIQRNGKIIWKELADAHKLDLTNVTYSLSEDGKQLVPVAARFI